MAVAKSIGSGGGERRIAKSRARHDAGTFVCVSIAAGAFAQPTEGQLSWRDDRIRPEHPLSSCAIARANAEHWGMKSRSFAGTFGIWIFAAALILGCSAAAGAQSYPDRPVRMLIAFPAGGTIDTLGRILAQKLTEAWGQNVVIENRAGAGGNIGAAAAAAAAPDGFTLHFGAQSLAVNVTIAPYQTLDPVKDFDPIILAATATDVLIVPLSSPFHTLRQLIDYGAA